MWTTIRKTMAKLFLGMLLCIRGEEGNPSALPIQLIKSKDDQHLEQERENWEEEEDWEEENWNNKNKWDEEDWDLNGDLQEKWEGNPWDKP
jgi:hypothetical protein